MKARYCCYLVLFVEAWTDKAAGDAERAPVGVLYLGDVDVAVDGCCCCCCCCDCCCPGGLLDIAIPEMWRVGDLDKDCKTFFAVTNIVLNQMIILKCKTNSNVFNKNILFSQICHFKSLKVVSDQRDHIGRILKVLGNKFSNKSKPNIWWLFGLFW